MADIAQWQTECSSLCLSFLESAGASDLKNVLKRKLQLPHVAVRRGNSAELRAAKSHVRQAPGRMVQDIERFPSNLQFMTLLWHAKTLVRGKVPVKTRRTNDCIAAGITEAIEWLQSECRRIEPLGGGRVRE